MGCTHQLHQGKAYVFDLETDGLYNECSKIHCLVLKDIHSNVVQTFSDSIHCNGTVDAGLTLLENADLIIGHNIIGFDLNVIDKVSELGFTSFAKGEVFDTLAGEGEGNLGQAASRSRYGTSEKIGVRPTGPDPLGNIPPERSFE